MGLLYKVDIGYSQKAPDEITGIGDIIFVDRNRFINIFSALNYSAMQRTKVTTLTNSGASNILYDSVIGVGVSDADISTMYIPTPFAYQLNPEAAVSLNDKLKSKIILDVFPSIKLGYPQWTEFVTQPNRPGINSVVIKFNSLNKIYAAEPGFSGSGPRWVKVFTADSFVEIFSLSGSTSTTFPFLYSYTRTPNYDNSDAFYYIGIRNTNIPWSEPSNTVAIFVEGLSRYDSSVSSNDGIYVTGNNSITINGSIYKILSAIFGEGEVLKPDIEYPLNPYNPIDPSGPSDGNGNFDDTSDPIPDSSLPTLSSSNTGFTRIYNPTLSQVQDLANYLWTDESVVETIWNKIRNFFENAMDAMIGFNLVPVPVPNSGPQEFKVMYIGTGVQMNVATSQFVDVDCGTLTLEPYYGSALDYSPYTKISCYLPYIGNVDLDPDEVMGATLQVKYRVDIVSGSCVAKIIVAGSVLYQYSGHCAITIPFAATDFSSYVTAAISVAKLAIGAATAGGGGATAAESITPEQQTTTITNTERNPDTGRQIITGRQVIESTRTPASQPSPNSFAGLAPANVANTVAQVMGSKMLYQHSGSFSGNTGYLGVRRPYLVIHRPNLCMPSSYQSMNGFPCMITLKLGDCAGYTKVQQVLLTGLSATNPEQAEILQLLKSGVVF